MAGYIGTGAVPQATQKRDLFTATAGQISFATSGYSPGYVDVYMNGVKLSPADFTATNGSDVDLAVAAVVDDILEIVSFTSFEVTLGGLQAANNLSDLVDAPTAITNLGVTSTAAELNKLTGATLSTAELNQLNAITRGSIIYGNASGATARLAAGGVDTVLTSDGTDISWAAASSGGGGSRTLLQTVTASSDPTVLIGSSSLLSSTYKRYEILVENVVATTTIIGRVSIGESVKTANYMWGFLDISSRYGLTETQTGAGTTTSITLMNNNSFPTGASYNSTITLFDPSNTNLTKQIICSGIAVLSLTGYDVSQCLTYAAYEDGTAAIDGFQFSTASGSIVSGTFKLYGIT